MPPAGLPRPGDAVARDTLESVRAIRIGCGVALTVVAIGAGIAAWKATASDSASPAVRLIVIGDFGVGGRAERSFGAELHRYERSHRADLLVTVGDNAYETLGKFLASWRDSFGWLRGAHVGVAGALGNHDTWDGGRFEFGPLGMKGRYYTRRVGDVELFVLDSNSVDDEQTAWLGRALAASRAKWKIPVFHHPVYTCGRYAGHEDIRAKWSPLFERYGVKLVLNGHDHNYQRFAPVDGITYLVDGGGGTELYALVDCPSGYPHRVAGRTIRSFLYLVVTGSKLRGLALTPGGQRIDRFTISS